MVTTHITVDTLTAELTVRSIGAIWTRHVTRHSYPPLVTLTHPNRGVAHALRTRRITQADELVECQAVQILPDNAAWLTALSTEDVWAK